ncbi:MAG: F0F1 ATP synthase subunit gamma, partial [Rhodobacteraceae bacterium]|nr:F0F1 ATP synthase subunit gamma [Paracoccaceae bacterium]
AAITKELIEIISGAEAL